MTSDIIKNILLKFKVDDTEAKKAATNMSKGGMFGGGFTTPTGRQGIKDFQNVVEKLNKAGLEIPKSFEKAQKVLKQMASQDLKSLETQMTKLDKQFERRQKAYDRLRERGASEQTLGRAQGRINETFGRMSQTAEGMGQANRVINPEAKTLQQYAQDIQRNIMNSPMLRGLGAAGLLVSGAERASNMYSSNLRGRVATEASGSEIVRRTSQYYNNENMAEALIAAKDPTFNARMNDYISKQRGSAVIGAAKQSIYDDVTDLFSGNLTLMGGYGPGSTQGKRVEAEMARREIEARREFTEAEKQARVDASLYLPDFLNTADSRAAAQRRFRVDGTDAFIARQSGAMMSPEEVESMQQQLFSTLGARGGFQLGNRVGIGRQNYGLELGQSANLFSAVSLGAKGGTKDAEENFKKIMEDAIKSGFEGTGFMEALVQNTAAVLSSSNSRLNSGALMNEMLKFAPENADARQIGAMMGAKALSDQMQAGTSPLVRNINRANIRQALSGTPGASDLASDPAAVEAIMALSPEEMASGGNERTRAMGITPEMLTGVSKRRSLSSVQTSAVSNKYYKQAQRQMKQSGKVDAKTAARLTNAIYFSNFGDFKGKTAEEINQSMGKTFSDLGLVTDTQTFAQSLDGKTEEEKQQILKNYQNVQKAVTGTAEGQLFQRNIEKAKERDEKVQEAVAPYVKDIIKADTAAGVTMSNYQDRGNQEFGKQLGNAAEAVRDFTDALTKATQRLGGTPFGKSVGR